MIEKSSFWMDGTLDYAIMRSLLVADPEERAREKGHLVYVCTGAARLVPPDIGF